MPYRLQTDEEVQDDLRRCAREQLDRAITQLTDGVKDDPVTAVHDARKSLKKARSLMRLGRGTINRAERRRENAALRHAGRTLSSTRDAEVMLQAVDELADRFAGQLPGTTFDAIRQRLEAERDPARQRLLESGLTEQVADELRSVQARVDDWTLRRGAWKALEPGLLRTYRRGRAAFDRARSEPAMENLHEWRKRTKDLWYHLRMLKPVSPGIVGGQADEAHMLADLLGDDHDLAVLRETLETRAGELVVDLDAVLDLIDHRREQLQAEAMIVGQRLYAERPKAFAGRLHHYWKASQASRRVADTRRPVAVA
jgi:CHAD domain-containing protein